jgi:Arc/MetJ-type ribon-helix-helix transcriptional regulator
MSTTAYLDKESEERAKTIMEQKSYDSVSKVVKEALELMERELIEEQLREKYSQESPLDDISEEAQEETAEELGDYPW